MASNLGLSRLNFNCAGSTCDKIYDADAVDRNVLLGDDLDYLLSDKTSNESRSSGEVGCRSTITDI